MRHFWVPWLLLILAACRDKAPVDGAIRVSVQYGSYTPACLRVRVHDAQGHEGRTDILQSQFKNPEAKQIVVAVFRQPDWARELTPEVSSYDGSSGTECAGTLVEQHSAPEPITVPLGDFTRFDVTLRAQDGDGDTFIKKEEGVAGTDCDDARGNVHPGATELCSTQVDYDCDDAKGCQDSQCLDRACDDGDACTTGEHCQGSGATAVCTGGETKQCTQPAGPCLTGAACDSRTGDCVNQKAPPDTACNDNNPCTLNDQCGQDAQCAGTLKACHMPTTACFEAAGTCNTTTGDCEHPLKPASTSCDDKQACTLQDMCDAAGACLGVPTPCTASSPCLRVAGGCTALNNCTEEPDPAKVNEGCTLGGGGSGVCRALDGACSTFPYTPSNFDPDSIDTASIGSLNITCAVTFDSGALSWTPSNCITNPPQPLLKTQGTIEMVVLPVSTFNLGADLRLVGSRSVIFAVYGDATLNHHILANGIISGTNTVPGAGSNQNCTNVSGSDGTVSNGAGGGGGGAGSATAGGAGAQCSENSSTGGPAGGAGLSNFVPLTGGCPGGNGGDTTVGGKGGAGGGAVQISVARTLTVNQRISTSGGGGLGGRAATNQAGGGGGGGSGGQILLEAHQLNLASSAFLTANGGAGAEGAGYHPALRNDGNDGADGSVASADQATGGTGGSTSGGAGGKGGAGSLGPGGGTQGESVSSSIGGGGGGGGAVGHIRLRSVKPCSLNAAVISPPTNNQCPL